MATVPSNLQQALTNATRAYNQIKVERDAIQIELDAQISSYAAMTKRAEDFKRDSRTWNFASYSAWESNGKFAASNLIAKLKEDLRIKDIALSNAQKNIIKAESDIKIWLELDPEYQQQIATQKLLQDEADATQKERQTRNVLIFLGVLVVVVGIVYLFRSNVIKLPS